MAALLRTGSPRGEPRHRAPVELREVPSQRFPTLSAALEGLPAASAPGGVPSVVVRLAAGTHSGPLRLAGGVVLEGGGDGALPTLADLGPLGLEVTGARSLCVLRRLRIRADPEGHAVAVSSASPLIEDCELVGRGEAPTRGARAGLLVKGIGSWPVVRGCRVCGHGGAGVAIEEGGCGLFVCNEVTQCGAGFWVADGTAPVIWRNTALDNRGAGVVMRRAAGGRALDNTLMKNGTGALLESDRAALAVLAYNRVVGNEGPGMRQSPGNVLAGQAGCFLQGNLLKSNGPGAALEATWPRQSVRTGEELVAAVRAAPRDRSALVEVIGQVELQECLVLDRPVILVGSSEGPSAGAVGGPELSCSREAEAVLRIAPGAEMAALYRLALRAGPGPRGEAGAAGCVVVEAGSPAFLECHMQVGPAGGSGAGGFAHAVRVSGLSSRPLLAGCSLCGAVGAGLSLDQGASAVLVRCELSGNQQGGAYVEDGARLVLEECDVKGNRHFGVVAGRGGAVLGRTLFEDNASGDVWLCGGEGSPQGAEGPLVLDQCRFVGVRAAALRVGDGSAALSWQSSYAAGPGDSWGSAPSAAVAARVDPGGSLALSRGAEEGGGAAGVPTPAMAGAEGTWRLPEVVGGGDVQLLDAWGLPAWPRADAAAGPGAPRPGQGPPAPQGARAPARRAPRAERREPATAPQEAPPAQGPSQPDPQQFTREPLPDAGRAAAAHATGALPPPRVPLPEAPSSPLEDGVAAGSEASAGAGVPEGEEELRAWIGRLKAVPLASWKMADRRTLFAILAMLGRARKKPELVSTVGLGGPLLPGAEACLRAHTNRYLTARPGGAVDCKEPVPESQEQWVLAPKKQQKTPGVLKSGHQYTLTAADTIDGGEKERGLPGEWVYGASGKYTIEAVPGEPGRYSFEERLHEGGTVTGTLVEEEDGVQGRLDKDGSPYCELRVRLAGDFTAISSFRVVESEAWSKSMPAQRASSESALLLTVDGASGLASAQPAGSAQDQAFQVSVVAGEGGRRAPLESGSQVCLRAMPSGRMLEVGGNAVRASAGAQAQGTRQRFQLERRPPPEEVPEPAAPFEVSHEDQAWAFQRGVQLALVEKQHLADLLSGAKDPAPALLKLFAELWEREWRQGALPRDPAEGSERSNSPGGSGRRPSPASGRRGRAENWIRNLAGGVSTTEKDNGDLFVSALRSFFADTLRMSQLEANNVMRTVEAFAAALVADREFVQAFSASMLPEAQRKQYRTPEDVLFGLTYTTMMLNTDAHSTQVTQKTWDKQKFTGAGKDCGVQGALMGQIFKRITQDEL